MAEYIERNDVLNDLEIHLTYVKTLPAANVKPVRVGRWVVPTPKNYFPVCSLCGKFALADTIEEPVYSNYCPSCGATMENAGEHSAW